MPTYQYRCTECGTPLEAKQSFSDAPLTECPACGGRLRKVFSAVGIVFKGSGFYRTDSRASAGEGKAPAAKDGDAKRSDKGGDSKGEQPTKEPAGSTKASGSAGGSSTDGTSTGTGATSSGSTSPASR